MDPNSLDEISVSDSLASRIRANMAHVRETDEAIRTLRMMSGKSKLVKYTPIKSPAKIIKPISDFDDFRKEYLNNHDAKVAAHDELDKILNTDVVSEPSIATIKKAVSADNYKDWGDF